MRILKQLYFSFKRIVHNVVIISEDFFMNIETLHKGCSWIFDAKDGIITPTIVPCF